MNETDDELERAADRLRRRLEKTGTLKRREARTALGPLKHRVEEAAEALVQQELARKQPGQHGSWSLTLTEVTANLKPPTDNDGVAGAGRYGNCDHTGVVYKLADSLLQKYRAAGLQPNYNQVFTETRTAVARLQELRQLEIDAAVNRALLRQHWTPPRGSNAR